MSVRAFMVKFPLKGSVPAILGYWYVMGSCFCGAFYGAFYKRAPELLCWKFNQNVIIERIRIKRVGTYLLKPCIE